MRTFPDPDPMMRFVAEEEVPDLFWALPKQEQSLRIRLYLVVLTMGEYPIVCWTVAMDMTRQGLAFAHRIVDQWPDERLEEAMAREAQNIADRGQAPPGQVLIPPPVS